MSAIECNEKQRGLLETAVGRAPCTLIPSHMFFIRRESNACRPPRPSSGTCRRRMPRAPRRGSEHALPEVSHRRDAGP